jgi:hypothetical protein
LVDDHSISDATLTWRAIDPTSEGALLQTANFTVAEAIGFHAARLYRQLVSEGFCQPLP